MNSKYMVSLRAEVLQSLAESVLENNGNKDDHNKFKELAESIFDKVEERMADMYTEQEATSFSEMVSNSVRAEFQQKLDEANSTIDELESQLEESFSARDAERYALDCVLEAKAKMKEEEYEDDEDEDDLEESYSLEEVEDFVEDLIAEGVLFTAESAEEYASDVIHEYKLEVRHQLSGGINNREAPLVERKKSTLNQAHNLSVIII